MPRVTPASADIQVAEVTTGNAASEGTMSKMAANQNFQKDFGREFHHWSLTGKYNNVSGPEFIRDAGFVAFSKMQITGFAMEQGTPGSSGYLEFDIIRWTVAGSQASIFSTRPRLNFDSGTNTWLAKEFIGNTNLKLPTNAQSPVLAITTLQPGERLTMNITAKQGGVPIDASCKIGLIPIS